ncbi:MAG: hypothetical protein ACYCW6_14840 [Candidatus Xenobia bacterium]
MTLGTVRGEVAGLSDHRNSVTDRLQKGPATDLVSGSSREAHLQVGKLLSTLNGT